MTQIPLKAQTTEMPRFQRLVKEKNAFMIRMTVFFLAFYLLLPILGGYAKPLMATKVLGNLNVAYLFAFVQFVMGWVVAGMYVKRAARFDQEIAEIRKELGK